MSGKIEVCTEGVSRVLEEDDMMLINSNKGHATLAQKPDSIAMVIHINPGFLKEYYEEIEFLSFNLCSTKKTKNHKASALIRAYLSEMILYCHKKNLKTSCFLIVLFILYYVQLFYIFHLSIFSVSLL